MVFENVGAAKRSLPKPIPERLKEAREARGFTLEHFAEILDVSRQAVAQYETGQSAPSGDVMAKIIAATAQPPIFFIIRPARTGLTISPFWRSLKRMELHHRRRITRRLEWACDIAAYIERFIHLPEMNIPQIDHENVGCKDMDAVSALARRSAVHSFFIRSRKWP